MSNDFRILSLRGTITVDNTGPLIEQILEYNHMDSGLLSHERTPIHLHIQSNGGVPADSFALTDIILSSQTPVYTYCDGYVESAALYPYLAGSKRYVYKHSRFMHHEISITTDYTPLSEVASILNLYKNYTESINILFRERTNIRAFELDQHHKFKVDWHIDSIKAVELGIATDLI